MIKFLIQISFFTAFFTNTVIEYNVNLDEQGILRMNEKVCNQGISYDKFNEIIKAQPTCSKFYKMKGQELGWRCFFYQNIGLMAYSMPLKKQNKEYSISSIDLFFSHDKLYNKGRFFEGSIIINGVTVNSKSNFSQIFDNPNLKKYINMGIYEDKYNPIKNVIELELGTSKTQVFFNFKDKEGSQLESIHFSIR